MRYVARFKNKASAFFNESANTRAVDYLTACLYLLFGFAFLIFCADSLVRSAISIAYKFNINPSFVGLTLIAAGTSAPEIATSFMASLNGNVEIALGNVYGSNIFNLLVVLGVSALFSLRNIARDNVKIELPILGLLTLFMVYTLNGSELTSNQSYLFLALLCGFVVFAGFRAKSSDAAKDLKEEIGILRSPFKIFALLSFSLVGIAVGSHYALKGGIELGQLLGISERVIGLTIISIGTGLPELATSVMASLRGQNAMAFTNVLGSNIINSLGIPGVAALSGNVSINKGLFSFDAKVLTIITLLLFPLILINRYTLPKWQGALFVLGYGYYLSSVL